MKRIGLFTLFLLFFTSFIFSQEIENQVQAKEENIEKEDDFLDSADNKKYEEGVYTITAGYTPSYNMIVTDDGVTGQFSNGFTMVFNRIANDRNIGFHTDFGIHFPCYYNFSSANESANPSFSASIFDDNMPFHMKMTFGFGATFKIKTSDKFHLNISPMIAYDFDLLKAAKSATVFNHYFGAGCNVNFSLFANKKVMLTFGTNLDVYNLRAVFVETGVGSNSTIGFDPCISIKPYVGITYKFDYCFPQFL